jgi:hypothetical protein
MYAAGCALVGISEIDDTPNLARFHIRFEFEGRRHRIRETHQRTSIMKDLHPSGQGHLRYTGWVQHARL